MVADVLVFRRRHRLDDLITEAIAACDDAMSSSQRIQMAAAAGSRMAVINESTRLGHRANEARRELQRLFSDIDPDAAA